MNQREIYRAKSYYTKEWIEGYLMDENRISIPYDEAGIRFNDVVRVDPVTISKSVGKEYMNGEPAFEGDIFESQSCGVRMLLKYGTYDAYCPADECYMDSVGFYAEAVGLPKMPIGDLSDYALKIGNIFDNPELLKNQEFGG